MFDAQILCTTGRESGNSLGPTVSYKAGNALNQASASVLVFCSIWRGIMIKPNSIVPIAIKSVTFETTRSMICCVESWVHFWGW